MTEEGDEDKLLDSESYADRGNRDKAHNRTQKSSTPVIPVQKKSTFASDPTFQVCAEHNRPLEIYCLDSRCMDLVCANCALFGSHRGHRVRERQELVDDTIDMIDDLKLVSDCIAEAQTAVKQKASVDRWCRQMADRVQNKESEINLFFEVETQSNSRSA
jgi:B-box zinc finger